MSILTRIVAFTLAWLPLILLAQPKPNIIVIVADDLGYSDLGCYGGEIQTPHLDRLAKEGIRFTQFYNNAKCTQTRAALLSGLYHHQTQQSLKTPNHVTMAEVLKDSGYRTLMSGKWHLSKTPLDRGFDRYFGFLNGAVNFFTGMNRATGENFMRLDREVFKVPKEGFYTTDAFTDYAIEFINEANAKKKPFFLYLAHNAPHFPLHALPEDIAKYRGKYKKGWDALRQERFERMKKLGIISKKWSLTPRDAIVPLWDTLTEKQKDEEDLLMAVYAAMVDRLDQNIGRLTQHLMKAGLDQNTLILFFSDNGGCPYEFDRTPDLPPGPKESYRTYNSEWANVSNTPFRLYKQWSHEGGISTPMIAHWPKGIKNPGTTDRSALHLIDVFPTLLELAKASYPKKFNGKQILPLEGESFLTALEGKPLNRKRPLFFEYQGNRAVRWGDWKLVAERSMKWELYNIPNDRTETQNLIQVESERASKLASLYEEWAKRTGALSNQASVRKKPSTQKR